LAKGIPDFANFDDERAKCLAGAVFPTQQACQLERARSSQGSRLLRYRIQYTEKQKRWNRKMSGLLLCSPDGQSVFPIAVDGSQPSDGS
jgi:hypothetical protein